MEGAKPAIMWFLRKFNVDLAPIVSAFRRARVFDPVVAQGLNITPDVVRGLSCFPFLAGEGVLRGIEDELPAYLAAIIIVHLESAIDKWHCMVVKKSRARSLAGCCSQGYPCPAIVCCI